MEAIIILSVEAVAFNLWSYRLSNKVLDQRPDLGSYRMLRDPRTKIIATAAGLLSIVALASLFILEPDYENLNEAWAVLLFVSLAVLGVATFSNYRKIRRLLR